MERNSSFGTAWVGKDQVSDTFVFKKMIPKEMIFGIMEIVKRRSNQIMFGLRLLVLLRFMHPQKAYAPKP